MIIYQIRLPKKQDAEAFVKFMRDDYFPAVLKAGPTRTGQATDLTLLQRENQIEGEDTDHEFPWLVGWSGQPTGSVHADDEKVVGKFQSFGASVKRIGSYREVSARRRHEHQFSTGEVVPGFSLGELEKSG